MARPGPYLEQETRVIILSLIERYEHRVGVGI